MQKKMEKGRNSGFLVPQVKLSFSPEEAVRSERPKKQKVNSDSMQKRKVAHSGRVFPVMMP